MDAKTPSTLPVTVRRNPPRKGRPTPSSTLPVPVPPTTTPHKISSFPLQDILDIKILESPENLENPEKPELPSIPTVDRTNKKPPENLKVFLRIRPLTILTGRDRNVQNKNVWPKNPKLKNAGKPKAKKNGNLCIAVNDEFSITISPPEGLQDSKRVKSEVYEGFSHVFASEATQVEVYEKLFKPLVDDFLKGKSGMLAAVGPSGSGKTHTMFGCVREPGMVPLALGEIFSDSENKSENEPRTLYMSMFEISSEKGKSERISDLLQGGGHDLPMQHSTLKGVQQVKINNVQEAESLLACGLLKRATAGTNTNSQSSRSQCIINFRQATREVDDQSDYSELTIVDLAGAEREKRTGNQGTRLLESNFINNTSMVFGLCLRALLEHQKNPKRQLQKHFQNSLLTRYLRDYLEGKKRMSLILTVKPSEEDYLDTSFVLRQAAPYMQIKFSIVEQPNNLTCKRPSQTPNRTEPLKRRRRNGPGAIEIKDEKILGNSQLTEEGPAIGSVEDANLNETSITDEKIIGSPQITEEGPAIGNVEDEKIVGSPQITEEGPAIGSVENANLNETSITDEKIIGSPQIAEEGHALGSVEDANLNETSITDEKILGNPQITEEVCHALGSVEDANLNETSITDEKILGNPQITEEGHAIESVEDANLIETSITEESLLTFTEADRNYKVLEGLSKAMWKVLKEYNAKLKETQKENCFLNAELAKEKERCSDLESLIQDVKFKCSCQKEASASNMNGLQKPSLVSCIMEKSGQNSIEHARDSFDKSPSACVPSRVMVEISKWCSPQQDGTSPKNVNYRPNNEASETPMDSCLQSCEGLDKPTEIYRSGENINQSIDKLKSVDPTNEESCISSVSEVLPLTNFNDSGDSEHLVNVTHARPEYIHHNLTTEDTTDLEITEVADSAALLPDSNTENLSSPEQHLTCSSNLESVVSSSQFPNSTTEIFRDEGETVRESKPDGAALLPDSNPDNLSSPKQHLTCSSSLESVVSSSQFPNSTTEIFSDEGETADESKPDSNPENLSTPEQHLTCSSNLESVVSSPLLPNSTTDRSVVTKDKQLEKVSQINERTSSQESDGNNVSMAAGISSPAKDSQNLSKPKRRLLPVSSLLLKDMSSLAIQDETDKRKGARVEKKVYLDEKIRTQSKTSLLQLLHRNVV